MTAKGGERHYTWKKPVPGTRVIIFVLVAVKPLDALETTIELRSQAAPRDADRAGTAVHLITWPDSMARVTRADSRGATLTLIRRSLEVRWGWRVLFAFIPAAVGAGIVTQGGASAMAGAVLLAVALGILALPLFGPERARRRMLATARDHVPDSDGWVTLVGIAGEAGECLMAPYSNRRCLAYWARKVASDSEDRSRDAGTDSEQRAATCDFTLDVWGVRVQVMAQDAALVFDRSRGEVVSFANDAVKIEPLTAAHRGLDRQEEILLLPGERVVVRGMLVRAGDGPYRETTRIVPGRGRPVTIALGASSDS